MIGSLWDRRPEDAGLSPVLSQPMGSSGLGNTLPGPGPSHCSCSGGSRVRQKQCPSAKAAQGLTPKSWPLCHQHQHLGPSATASGPWVSENSGGSKAPLAVLAVRPALHAAPRNNGCLGQGLHCKLSAQSCLRWLPDLRVLPEALKKTEMVASRCRRASSMAREACGRLETSGEPGRDRRRAGC